MSHSSRTKYQTPQTPPPTSCKKIDPSQVRELPKEDSYRDCSKIIFETRKVPIILLRKSEQLYPTSTYNSACSQSLISSDHESGGSCLSDTNQQSEIEINKSSNKVLTVYSSSDLEDSDSRLRTVSRSKILSSNSITPETSITESSSSESNIKRSLRLSTLNNGKKPNKKRRSLRIRDQTPDMFPPGSLSKNVSYENINSSEAPSKLKLNTKRFKSKRKYDQKSTRLIKNNKYEISASTDDSGFSDRASIPKKKRRKFDLFRTTKSNRQSQVNSKIESDLTLKQKHQRVRYISNDNSDSSDLNVSVPKKTSRKLDILKVSSDEDSSNEEDMPVLQKKKRNQKSRIYSDVESDDVDSDDDISFLKPKSQRIINTNRQAKNIVDNRSYRSTRNSITPDKFRAGNYELKKKHPSSFIYLRCFQCGHEKPDDSFSDKMRETFPRRCLQCTVGLHPNYMGHLDNIVKTNKALIQMEDEFLDTDQSQDSDYSQDSFVVSDGHIS